MSKWSPLVTSNLDIGGGQEGTLRRLAIRMTGTGAGDTLKIGGRIPGESTYTPIALKKKGTDAVVPGATGIVNDPDVFHVDVTGLEVQLQYTKALNNPTINWSEGIA